MTTPTDQAAPPSTQTGGNWTSTQAYLLAVITLIAGVAVGYLVRGSRTAPAAVATNVSNPHAGMPGDAAAMGQQNVTPEMLKRMADKQAEPLLAQLKDNPGDAELLTKTGNIYYDTRNFNEAIEFYKKAVAIRDSAPVRTDLGTAYWYLGDADAAIREYEAALKVDPNHGSTYFNLGLVRWQGKMDVDGAVAAWQTLLRKHPNYENRQELEAMIARAKQHANIKPGTRTDKPAM